MTPSQMQRSSNASTAAPTSVLPLPDQSRPSRGRDRCVATGNLPDHDADSVTPDLTVQSGRHEIVVDRLEAARFMMLWASAASNQDWVMGADLLTTLLSEGRRSRLVRGCATSSTG